jgi:hypothetical protein
MSKVLCISIRRMQNAWAIDADPGLAIPGLPQPPGAISARQVAELVIRGLCGRKNGDFTCEGNLLLWPGGRQFFNGKQ